MIMLLCSGKAISFNAVQLSNAPSRMYITESGMVTDSSTVQLAKAESPMLCTVSGIS